MTQSIFDWRTSPPSVPVDTSEAAAESVAECAETMRQRVLDAILAMDGATCDEVEERLNMKHQTCSARVCELRRMGMIRDSGKVRKTRSGRNAVVWEVVPF